jgi:hypothetical protein
MNKLHAIAGAVAVAAISVSADAALITLDDGGPGRSASVGDTLSSMVWINLSKTFNISFADPLPTPVVGNAFADVSLTSVRYTHPLRHTAVRTVPVYYPTAGQVRSWLQDAGLTFPDALRPAARDDAGGAAVLASAQTFVELSGGAAVDDAAVAELDADTMVQTPADFTGSRHTGGFKLPVWGSRLLNHVAGPIPEASAAANLVAGFGLLLLLRRRMAQGLRKGRPTS